MDNAILESATITAVDRPRAIAWGTNSVVSGPGLPTLAFAPGANIQLPELCMKGYRQHYIVDVTPQTSQMRLALSPAFSPLTALPLMIGWEVSDAAVFVDVVGARRSITDLVRAVLQIAAVNAGGRSVSVTGTSFAAPLVAAELAAHLPAPSPDGATEAVRALQARAIDRGRPGHDPIYGWGEVRSN